MRAARTQREKRRTPKTFVTKQSAHEKSYLLSCDLPISNSLDFPDDVVKLIAAVPPGKGACRVQPAEPSASWGQIWRELFERGLGEMAVVSDLAAKTRYNGACADAASRIKT
jgi:hypothetical protein